MNSLHYTFAQGHTDNNGFFISVRRCIEMETAGMACSFRN